MGVHVVGEMKVKVDFGSGGQEEFRIRHVPEESTNDLGIPLTVETQGGEVRLLAHRSWVDILLGQGLCLRLRPQSQGVSLSFTLPYREWLGHKEAVHLEYTALRELAGEKAPREEFLRRLKSALSVLASIPEDVEEIL